MRKTTEEIAAALEEIRDVLTAALDPANLCYAIEATYHALYTTILLEANTGRRAPFTAVFIDIVEGNAELRWPGLTTDTDGTEVGTLVLAVRLLIGDGISIEQVLADLTRMANAGTSTAPRLAKYLATAARQHAQQRGGRS